MTVLASPIGRSVRVTDPGKAAIYERHGWVEFTTPDFMSLATFVAKASQTFADFEDSVRRISDVIRSAPSDLQGSPAAGSRFSSRVTPAVKPEVEAGHAAGLDTERKLLDRSHPAAPTSLQPERRVT